MCPCEARPFSLTILLSPSHTLSRALFFSPYLAAGPHQYATHHLQVRGLSGSRFQFAFFFPLHSLMTESSSTIPPLPYFAFGFPYDKNWNSFFSYCFSLSIGTSSTASRQLTFRLTFSICGRHFNSNSFRFIYSLCLLLTGNYLFLHMHAPHSIWNTRSRPEENWPYNPRWAFTL